MTVKKTHNRSMPIRRNIDVVSKLARKKHETPADVEVARTGFMGANDHSEARKQTVITILTGRRPALLWRTLKTLTAQAPKLVAEARVVALANGADIQTLDTLKKAGWVKEVIETPKLLPIGEAFSFLMQKAALGDSRYILHLEDDWDCVGAEDSWFHRAVQCIDVGVGQIRLRYVRDTHMVTNALSHQTIVWDKVDGGSMELSKNAHFTFNPSLVSTTVMQGLHPCSGETDAMRKFGGLRLQVARVLPGAFIHSGGDESLAERTKGR